MQLLSSEMGLEGGPHIIRCVPSGGGSQERGLAVQYVLDPIMLSQPPGSPWDPPSTHSSLPLSAAQPTGSFLD